MNIRLAVLLLLVAAPARSYDLSFDQRASVEIAAEVFIDAVATPTIRRQIEACAAARDQVRVLPDIQRGLGLYCMVDPKKISDWHVSGNLLVRIAPEKLKAKGLSVVIIDGNPYLIDVDRLKKAVPGGPSAILATTFGTPELEALNGAIAAMVLTAKQAENARAILEQTAPLLNPGGKPTMLFDSNGGSAVTYE